MTAPQAGTRALRWRPRPNPVLRRELVERWRGKRAFVVLTLHLVVLTAMTLLLLWAATAAMSQGIGPALDPGPALGRFLLENVLAIVLALVLFVGPGYAAAQIAQERERHTLGLLQITLVSPWRIVTGKLGAACAWLLLLVLVAAPLAAAAFFLGGVTGADLLRGVTYLAAITVAVAAIGIGVSSVARRTVGAVVLTYGVVLALVGGTLFGAAIEAAVTRERPVTILANPFVGLADAVRSTGAATSQLPSALTLFAEALPAANRGGSFVALDDPVAQGEDIVAPFQEEQPFELPVFDRAPSRRPVWVGLLVLYSALGALGLLVAARRVRPDHGPARFHRRPRAPREVVAPAPATSDATPPPPPPPPSPPESP